jgi:hypothetical protein
MEAGDKVLELCEPVARLTNGDKADCNTDRLSLQMISAETLPCRGVIQGRERSWVSASATLN